MKNTKGLIYEDELPKMTEKQYGAWFKTSQIVSGVRMGYPVNENGDLI